MTPAGGVSWVVLHLETTAQAVQQAAHVARNTKVLLPVRHPALCLPCQQSQGQKPRWRASSMR
jgi:hypothetical protein